MNTNKKTLSMKIKSSKAYSIALYGFVFAATLFFRVRTSISVTILPQFITQLVTVLREGKLSIVAVMKQTGKIVTVINSKRISLVISASEIGKLVTDIAYSSPISFVSSAVQKLITTMKTGKLTLAISPTLASFFLLGTYDPTTLATQDVKTLGAMDYTS